jgi:hypothetical protein
LPLEDLAELAPSGIADRTVAMGLLHADVDATLAVLAAGLKMAIENLDATLTSGWPSGPVIDTVLARVDRLESGEPMGGSAGRSSRRRRQRAADITTQTTLSTDRATPNDEAVELWRVARKLDGQTPCWFGLCTEGLPGSSQFGVPMLANSTGNRADFTNQVVTAATTSGSGPEFRRTVRAIRFRGPWGTQ